MKPNNLKSSMIKYILFTGLLAILTIQSYSQITFENGYFANESGQRINCLIKNNDWKNNPIEFEYQLSADDPIQTADIQNIKEFGINGVSKYVRAIVKIDKSGDDLNNMSSERNPVFQEDSLFLKVLIDGKTSLFFYEEGNLTRFFYKTNDSEIQQLVYKRYLLNNKIAQNNQFKQQIFIDLKCQSITEKNVENIDYNKKDLTKLFARYNECINSEYIDYTFMQKKDLFNLSIRPGVNNSSLSIENVQSDTRNTDFGNNLNFRLGIELEFILPYNKNKWGIIIEPTYQYFKSEKRTETKNVSGGILISEVNYQSIELPVGIRHYFFLNDNSKIFADFSYVFDFSNNSEIKFTRSNGTMYNTLEVKPRRNLALGIGYKLKDKYSIGMRYQTGREILGSYLYWNSSYKTLSVIFGYSLF